MSKEGIQMLGRARRGATRGSLVWVAAIVATFAMGGVAAAVPIDDVDLHGGGPTIWDPESRKATQCLDMRDGFTPVNNGEFDGNFDAFDDGLMLLVRGVTFRDPDNNGRLSGEQLTVGPGRAAGLRVTRIERALQGSPTLRSLIAFENRRDRRQVATIQWDSNLGSDGLEEVRGSSDGDTLAEVNDRWIVSSDHATTPDDPPVVFVLWGRNASVRTQRIIEAPGDECFTISMRIKVPARSTRYLLFFTEMTDDDNAVALASAEKFDDVGPGSPLLNGIRPRVRDRILNWNV